MTIIKKLRAVFPGISVHISALIRARKAYLAHNKAIKAVNAVIAPGSVAIWVQNVSEHSLLSYEEAYRIYNVITEETDLCKSMQSGITEFVVEMANRGHTGGMIIFYLLQIDRELNKWKRGKLRMPP